MEQKQSVVTVNVNCVAGDNNVINNDESKPVVKNRRRRRGHGWSHKKQRKKKSQGQNYLCYVVFDGEKTYIFWKWKECEKKVKHCNSVYKGFHSRIAAADWLRDQQATATVKRMLQQQSVAKTNIPTATATVISNESTMHVSTHSAAGAEALPFATAVPVPMPTAVPRNPTKRRREEMDFSPVAEMARLIASCFPDDMPQPPVCTCATCPYMSGEIVHIRKVLLARLYQTGLITVQHKD